MSWVAPADESGQRTRTQSVIASSAQLQEDDSALQILPIWKMDQDVVSKSSRDWRSLLEGFYAISPQHSTAQLRSGDHVTGGACMLWSFLIVRPGAPVRISWELLSLFVIAYDMVTLPLAAFNYEDMDIASTLSMTGTAFWTTDILASFLSGYNDGGVVEMRPGRIARRYLKSWFAFDVMIVAVDWVFFFINAGNRSAVVVARLGKTTRAFRIVRMLRLLRVARLKEIFQTFGSFIYSEGLFAAMTILKLLFSILFMNHFVGCAWYAIGTLSLDSGQPTWLSSLDEEGASMIYRYAISFHWSIAQFTPAPVNYHPGNATERIFAILVLLVGFVVFTSFLGSVTSLVTNARQSGEFRAKQDRKMRAYVIENKVSLQLSSRLSSFLRQHQRKHERVHEDEVDAFKHLPETLLMQLRFEVYSPWLLKHIFFSKINEVSKELIYDLCHTAISTQALANGDELFHSGLESRCMIFVISGCLEYVTKNGASSCSTLQIDPEALGAGKAIPVSIMVGEWLCEAALWMRWAHRGKLTAKDSVDIMKLDTMAFQDAAVRNGHVLVNIRNYARLFVAEANKYGSDGLDDHRCLSDEVEEFADDAFGKVQDSKSSEPGAAFRWLAHFRRPTLQKRGSGFFT